MTPRTFDGISGQYYIASTTQDQSIYFFYSRDSYKINYLDGIYVDGNGNILDEDKEATWGTSGDILYQADISSYGKGGANYYTPAKANYVFDGWYIDKACTHPYNFTTMPKGGVTVYAKWRQIEYRVFLHPNAGTDPNLDWGSDSVSTSFRVSLGDTVSTPTGKREGSGYEFVGWYTDPSLSSSSLFSSYIVLNEDTVTTPYDKTESTETDKWGNPTQQINKDIDRFWITKKLDLYAKWRKILEGAEGIGILYYPRDGKGNTGRGMPTDTSLYPDLAEATAQAACRAPEGMFFKHWVVQDWDETQGKYVDTNIIVKPGEKFIVREEYAEKAAVADQPGKYTYTIRLRPEFDEAADGESTHIWWFKNYSDNDAGRHDSFHQNEDIGINEAVPIPDAPARDGYIFLGWARVLTGTSESAAGTEGNPPTGKVLELTENDIYLKYQDGKYYLNDATSDYNGREVTQVAADDRLQYHDMYAVWQTRGYLQMRKQFDVQNFYLDGEDMEKLWTVLEFTVQDSQGNYVKLKKETEGVNAGHYIYDGVVTPSEVNAGTAIPKIPLSAFVRESGSASTHEHTYTQLAWLPVDTYTFKEDVNQARTLLPGYRLKEGGELVSEQTVTITKGTYGNTAAIGSGMSNLQNKYTGEDNYSRLKVTKTVKGHAPQDVTNAKRYYFVVINDTMTEAVGETVYVVNSDNDNNGSFTTDVTKATIYNVKPNDNNIYTGDSDDARLNDGTNGIKVVAGNEYHVVELTETTTPAVTADQSPEISGYTWTGTVSPETVTPVKGTPSAITLTNDYKANFGSLNLTKIAAGEKPNGVDDHEFLMIVKNEDGKFIKDDGTVSDDEVTIAVKPGETKTIENLLPGQYTVSEKTEAPDPFPAYSLEVAVAERTPASTENPFASATETNESAVVEIVAGQQKEVVVQNTYTLIRQNVKIQKVNESGSGLSGATFDLTSEETIIGFNDLRNLVSMNTEGKIGFLPSGNSADDTLFSLPIGQYILTEISAPAGYNKLSGLITFNVTEDGISLLGGNPMNVTLTKDESSGVWTITIPNQPGVELPATGGSGTALYYILGAALVLGAGVALMLMKKKKHE